MNSLSTTETYKTADQATGSTEILGKLAKGDGIENYIIPATKYNHLAEFRMFKNPLSSITTACLKDGDIIPILLQDPVDPKEPKLILPNFFVFALPYQGRRRVFVDMSIQANYVRSKGSSSIELLNADQKFFYGFCQEAATMHLLLKHEASLEDGRFPAAIAEMYVGLLSKSIDKFYPFSHNPSEYDLLIFLLGVYFYRTLVGLDLDMAYRNAERIRLISNKMMISSSKVKQLNIDINSLSALVAAVETEFNNVRKGAITNHLILGSFTRMYGANSIYAVEHFFSFLSMVQMSNLWLGLFTDRSINVLTAAKLKDVETILASLSK